MPLGQKLFIVSACFLFSVCLPFMANKDVCTYYSIVDQEITSLTCISTKRCLNAAAVTPYCGMDGLPAYERRLRQAM